MGLAWPLEMKPDATQSVEGTNDERLPKIRRLEGQPSASSSLPKPGIPPVTGVAVVCRENPSVDSMPHIVDWISEFADGAQCWRVARVPHDFMTARLLKRLHARELRDPLINDRFFRDWQFNQAANEAAAHGNLEVLKWLVTEYNPGGVMTEAVVRAAKNGHLEVVKWLYEEYLFVVLGMYELDEAFENAHMDVAKYLLANPPPLACRMPQSSNNEWMWGMSPTFLSDSMFGSASLEYLQWVVEGGYYHTYGLELHHAARHGRLDVVQWLAGRIDRARNDGGDVERYDHDSTDNGDMEENCTVQLSHLVGPEAFAVARWLHEQNFSWLTLTATPTATARNLQYVDYANWLLESGYVNCSAQAIDYAASQGNLEIVLWYHENSSDKCTTAAMDEAAKHGHLEILRWLHDNRSEGCSDAALTKAIANEHFAVAKWLLEIRPEIDHKAAMEAAAIKGNLELVMLLYNRFFEENPSGCLESSLYNHIVDKVAELGHLLVLQFLLENRIAKCSSSTMNAAAAANQLKVVVWLSENRTEGCTTDALNKAAKNGHLEMVQWLHKNRSEGCTRRAMNGAIANGHLHVVKYLYENRDEGASPCHIDVAAERGHFEMVRWLTEYCGHEDFARGTTNAMDNAATKGHLRMVQYLHEHRSEGCTTKAMDMAAANGHFEVMLYLHENRTEGSTAYATTRAILFGRLEILRWLVFHYPQLYSREKYSGNLEWRAKPYVAYWLRCEGLLVKG